jgi:hypothetical protein
LITAKVLLASAAYLAARGEVAAALACCDAGADEAWSVAELRVWADHRLLGAALLHATGRLGDARDVFAQVMNMASQAAETEAVLAASSGGAMVALHQEGLEAAEEWLDVGAAHVDASLSPLAEALLLAQRQRCRGLGGGQSQPQFLVDIIAQEIDEPLEPFQSLRLRFTVAEALLAATAIATGVEKARMSKLTNSRLEAIKPQRIPLLWRAEAWRMIGDWHQHNGREDPAAAAWRQAREIGVSTDARHQVALAALALARQGDDDGEIASAREALTALGARHDGGA